MQARLDAVETAIEGSSVPLQRIAELLAGLPDIERSVCNLFYKRVRYYFLFYFVVRYSIFFSRGLKPS